jgi:hypothetical protein
VKLSSLSVFCVLFAILAMLPYSFRTRISNPESHEYTPPQFDGPAEFLKFHRAIRTPDDLHAPAYEPGYLVRETKSAKTVASARSRNGRTQSNGVSAWTEHGPVNVPGRTRGLIVDPGDPNRNTWYAGSASGGVWKTTNGGQLWNLITPDLPNLATTVLAMAPSNPNTIYMGTGEGFGNLDGVAGNGMYKSNDRGVTWTYLPATSGFTDVNRAIVDPGNQDILVVATNNGIYRSTNGGVSFTKTLNENGMQDLKATPGNFQIQYATENSEGVWKSVDSGVTWQLANAGMKPVGRVEIDVSPVKTDRIFASAETSSFGSDSKLLMSDDGGITWALVDVSLNGSALDFLNDQGWYNNTVLCDPFNSNIVYLGGVDLFRVTLTGGSSNTGFYDHQLDNVPFLNLVLATFNNNGLINVGSTANGRNVELRFGAGVTQMAHRFEVPPNRGPGVAASEYSYRNYVEVPFQAWDVSTSPNRQLMVSFRDQNRNGSFDLIPFDNTNANTDLQSREYILINDVDYATTASSIIGVNGGGHEINLMYSIWPTLINGFAFPPTAPGKLLFRFNSQLKLNATTAFITDGRGQYGDPNRNSVVHVDHHNLVAIPMTTTTYKILNANDGGIAVSNVSATPGINNGNWTSPGLTYNTSQFYGADKRPGRNQFIGGTQDNGTWVSQPNVEATATTTYNFAIGGDGFEAIWHNGDDRKLIGGFQGNGFRRSVDGGFTWTSATSGLSGSAPFISKLANSRNNPEVVFTLSSDGVFRSTNFGASWTLTPITTLWGAPSSTMDVEVSRANANVIWAGSRISSVGRIHVSTDGGLTFSPTANYTVAALGNISKLGSHPTEPNTAFAIFSFRGRPKILRTTNLGASWQDITGFGSGSTSTNGFPDVAVYCVYVRPDNPNIIWAGTEIGIVQSLDAGVSWALLDDFPNISVWDMKGLDNQVIIATHGRGIWSATVDQNQIAIPNPTITTSGTTPRGDFAFKIKLDRAFDSVVIRVNQLRVGKIQAAAVGEYIATIRNVPIGTVNMEAIGFVQSAPATSSVIAGNHFQLALPMQDQYFDYFQIGENWRFSGLLVQGLGGDNALQSPHNYSLNTQNSALLRKPIKVRASEAKVYYRDVALVEPGLPGSTFPQPEFKDYVVLEATKNGVDWLPISPGYDAALKANWQAAFTASQPGNRSLMHDQVWDITPTFAATDTLLFRFRLFSDANITGWGWAIDDLYIQQVPTGVEDPSVSGLTAYPNPTSGDVTVRYRLETAARVKVEVLSPTGQSQMAVDAGELGAGSHETRLSLRGSAGVYVVRVSAGEKTAMITRVVLR